MITEEVWEEAWEVIARVRDAYPSADDDGPPTDEIVEALADAGLLARTEAWEDNALAEAWDEGYQDGLRQGGEGEDGPRYVNPYRAAGRAETTAATTEDALDSLPYFTFEDDDVAPDEEFVRKADVARLLATARTHPARDDISDAIERSGIAIGTSDAERAADAVLALLQDGDLRDSSRG